MGARRRPGKAWKRGWAGFVGSEGPVAIEVTERVPERVLGWRSSARRRAEREIKVALAESGFGTSVEITRQATEAAARPRASRWRGSSMSSDHPIEDPSAPADPPLRDPALAGARSASAASRCSKGSRTELPARGTSRCDRRLRACHRGRPRIRPSRGGAMPRNGALGRRRADLRAGRRPPGGRRPTGPWRRDPRGRLRVDPGRRRALRRDRPGRTVGLRDPRLLAHRPRREALRRVHHGRVRSRPSFAGSPEPSSTRRWSTRSRRCWNARNSPPRGNRLPRPCARAIRRPTKRSSTTSASFATRRSTRRPRPPSKSSTPRAS